MFRIVFQVKLIKGKTLKVCKVDSVFLHAAYHTKCYDSILSLKKNPSSSLGDILLKHFSNKHDKGE
jgi:hypothetical protein